MQRRTRTFLLNIATGIAIAATAAVVLLPAAASAAPATATSNVNVRQGPGTQYAAVGVIATGQVVDVRQCSGGWCLIDSRGLDGWVSSTYLNQRGGGTVNLGPVNPGIGLPNITIGINPPPPPRPTYPPPGPGPRPPFPGGPGFGGGPGHGPGPGFGGGPGFGPGNGPGFGHRNAQACFYDDNNFRGRSFCLNQGDTQRSLNRGMDISSINNPDGLRVRVCTSENLRGECRIYTSSTRDLGRFDVRSVSIDR